MGGNNNKRGRGGYRQQGTRQQQRSSTVSGPSFHRPRSLSAKRPRTDDSASDISDFISHVSKDETKIKTFVAEILKNQAIKDVLLSSFQTQIIETFKNRIEDLETRLEEMEQYSRRTCLKFSGIPEAKENETEDTDQLVLQVINESILKNIDEKLSLKHIGRSHRLGKRNPDVPRNIIVRFSTYRYRALVYRNKRNLKERNDNPNNKSKIYVNEALTARRVNLFKKARKLYNDKLIKNCWTSDGRIFVRNKSDTQTVLISTEADLSQFLNIRIQNTDGNLSIIPPASHLLDYAGALNISAPPFRPGSFSSTPAASEHPARSRSMSGDSIKSNL